MKVMTVNKDRKFSDHSDKKPGRADKEKWDEIFKEACDKERNSKYSGAKL